MAMCGVDLKVSDRWITISTINKTKRNDILKIIHRAIMRCGNRLRGELNAFVVGECQKDYSSYSRSWHICFSKDITQEEKKEITEAINSSDKVKGRKNIITKWGLHNDKDYVLLNEKHTYFREFKII